MRCERCSRVFRDGDIAYEIGVKRIHVRGKVARVFNVDIYVCTQCVQIEDGECK